MQAEIITIGDELLIGQVIDSNSAWIAEQLNMTGIRVARITSISDNRGQIIKALGEALQRAELVLTTGGLGPTKDDITKAAFCDFFETRLVFHQESYDNIERIFVARGYPMTALNRAQAEVPECCTPLVNRYGTAPGMFFEKDGRLVISMPGVPFEMKSLMEEQVIPRIRGLSHTSILHRTILTHGVGESFLAAKIEDFENALPVHIKLAYLPQPGMVRLRLTANGPDFAELKKELEKQADELYRLIPEYIFGENDDTLEEITGKLLREKNLTLATAESCTGGYIAHLITSVPGSSAYFKGSVVAYSNEIKENILGVSALTIKKYGAVSQETVFEMAAGIIRHFNTNCAIAVSGIAGPDGGTPEKPVGTTWVSVLSPMGAETRKFTFGEHRGRNIRRAALAGLDMLRKQLMSQNSSS